MRATHQGQQSSRTAPTGRTHDCKRHLHHAPHDLLQGGGHPHMNRRNLLLTSLLASLSLHGLPSAAEAADKVYRVGILAPEGMRAIERFKDRLRELGWIE